MITCPDDGRWQAWLDGELDPDEHGVLQQHLSTCSRCQRSVRRLQDLARWQGELLRPLQHAATAGGTDVTTAWAALQTHLAAAGVNEIPAQSAGGGVAVPAVTHSPARRWRWALVAAAVAAAATVALPPVQRTAAGLLRILRVNRVELVPFTPAMEAQILRALNGDGTGGTFDLERFGRIEVSAPAGRPLTPDEAQQPGDLPPLPARLGGREMMNAWYRPQVEVRLTPKVAALNELLARLGSPDRLPAALDGQTVRIAIPAQLSAEYGEKDGAVWPNVTYVMRLRAPTLAVPAGLDVEAVQRALRSLPFLPEPLRRHLEATGDWRTVPLPVPARLNPQQVEVGGLDVWLVESGPGRSGAMWLEGGVITFLDAEGNQERILALVRELRGGGSR